MPGVPSAKRYAEAAFALALEQGQVDQWQENLAAVAEVLADPGLSDYLQAPRLTPGQRLGLLDRVLPPVQEGVRNLVALLLLRNALPLAPQVTQEYRRLVDQHRGVERARVRTAVPAEPEDRDKIARRLRDLVGREVVMDLETDPSILGGFVAQVGDKLLDGSTRTRLLQLRQAIVEGAPSSPAS